MTWSSTSICSNTSYITAPKAHSCVSGHYFLGCLPKDGCPICLNGTILTLSTILKCVAASATEAKLGALFLNGIKTKILRLTLYELGHPQPPTPIHCDNTTATRVVNNAIKRQQSRAMNMCYFWLLCQEAQRMIKVCYHPGAENLGDYQSKVQNSTHRTHVHPYYQHSWDSPMWLPRTPHPSERRGCVKRDTDPYQSRNPLPTLPSRSCPMTAAAG